MSLPTARPSAHPTSAWLRRAALAVGIGTLLAACGGDGEVDDPSAPAEAPDDDAADGDAPDGDATDPGDGGGDEDGDDEVDPAEAAAAVDADELGDIPVLMYHRLLDDGGGDFDNTPEQFEQELRDLHDEGYRFITTAELASGRIDVPAGTTPAVLTFDDSTREQFALTEDGEVDPDTAVGIMLDLADELDGFRATGSFYVLGSLFGTSDEAGAELLRELHDLGFELGNHTLNHANLGQLDDAGIREEVARGAANITDAVPDAEVTTFSLPFGVNPSDPGLLAEGEHDGMTYRNEGVLLVGSGPAVSPFHAEFDRWRSRGSARSRTGRTGTRSTSGPGTGCRCCATRPNAATSPTVTPTPWRSPPTAPTRWATTSTPTGS